MYVSRMVDVPASRKLTIDVPPDVPVGPIVLVFEPAEGSIYRPPRGTPKLGCLKGQIWMSDDFDAPMALVDAALLDKLEFYEKNLLSP
jgi:hypothetical protein